MPNIHFWSPGMEPWQNGKVPMTEEEMQECDSTMLRGSFLFSTILIWLYCGWLRHPEPKGWLKLSITGINYLLMGWIAYTTMEFQMVPCFFRRAWSRPCAFVFGWCCFFSQLGWPRNSGISQHLMSTIGPEKLDTKSWSLVVDHTYLTVFRKLDFEFNLGSDVTISERGKTDDWTATSRRNMFRC